MKHILKYLGIFFMLFAMSCGQDPKSNVVPNNEAPLNPNRVESTSNLKIGDSLDNRGNLMDSLDQDTRSSKMYADLNFTDEEIENYRELSRKTRNDWRMANSNAEINEVERIKLEDRIMKNFLNKKRYEQYQIWLKDNPVK